MCRFSQKREKMNKVKVELYNDNFQNYKRYNIPKAQLVVADIPYNLGVNAYASSTEWYIDGDNRNGESKKAGKAFFLTDTNFNIAEYMHFCSRLELWLACDTDARIPEFKRACEKLRKAGFSREKIKCYVLSYGKDMLADEQRARTVYEAGAMQFMQLYRDFSDTKTEYSTEWNAFARMWQRPAAICAHMERGTDFRDFHT